MTGKPVLAASASASVLFPEPASPVTMTRRPSAGGASLIAVSVPHMSRQPPAVATAGYSPDSTPVPGHILADQEKVTSCAR